MLNRCMQLHTVQPVSARWISYGLSLEQLNEYHPATVSHFRSHYEQKTFEERKNWISEFSMNRDSCDGIVQPIL
jgi:hypothetical protein